MTMKLSSFSTAAVVAAAALIGAAITPAPAVAQDTGWFWGGSSIVGGSGRQTVRWTGKQRPGEIIVSFGDRRLYHIQAGGTATSYPIAVPREQSRWEGVMTVSQKRINPPWTPTPTMRAENPRLPSWVPGGHPMNPLGSRGLYLGSSMYRIHGTDAPWTIGQAVSKGCIRMYEEDVKYLYDRVPLGTRVTVTWQRFNTGDAIATAPSSTSSSSSSSSGSDFWSFFDDEPAPPKKARATTQRRPSASRSSSASRTTKTAAAAASE
jgi:lipoprotein-anchoring transpeptidase ErfK/SrfK